MFYTEGTGGWLKYSGTDVWHRVTVCFRTVGSHTYVVEKNRTRFSVGPRDVLVVVGK